MLIYKKANAKVENFENLEMFINKAVENSDSVFIHINGVAVRCDYVEYMSDCIFCYYENAETACVNIKNIDTIAIVE